MVCKDHLALSSRPSNSRSTDPLEAADRPASGRQRRRSIDRQCTGETDNALARPTMHWRSIDGQRPIWKTGLSTVFTDHR
ncbi:hypothetical protein CROQUDRAFT_92800 [Cronartium quercuum f. sp. fusiforme G11]|uniref:Uncharacterized protein n=1 Tax=Cronartium quercuum f. sp. fusiforme G11 TaxID=708437 RepID=A0A9P6NI04_9BASI|nr:hypothetical protein CROQUDRAFT_92800 [Cronartium quercuum f. sp. fusiforme G11]